MPEARVLLGFDYGSKRLGVALGQTLTGSARPLAILGMVRQMPNWQRIEDLIGEWRPALLLVGLPLNLDGSQTHATEPARRFSRQLGGRFHLPVELVDERLTSKIAQQMLGKHAANGLDAMAAALIIQTWLTEHDHTTAVQY